MPLILHHAAIPPNLPETFIVLCQYLVSLGLQMYLDNAQVFFQVSWHHQGINLSSTIRIIAAAACGLWKVAAMRVPAFVYHSSLTNLSITVI